MSKIKILVIPPDKTGVGKFRITTPFSYIQEKYPEDFHIDIIYDIPNDKIFDDYQIIVAHSFIDNKLSYEQNIQLVETLKLNGKIVIIDFDDYWALDFRHPMFTYAQKNKSGAQKIAWMKCASYVTVTTPHYQNTIKKKFGLNNVLVFPNAIDETEEQYKPKPIPSDRIRFGWLGGSSHQHDIDLLKSGISITQQQAKDNVQFVLCGFDLRGKIRELNKETGEVRERDVTPEETVWYKYEQIFTNNYEFVDPMHKAYLKMYKDTPFNDVNLPYRRIWTKDITRYATSYNNFDVSLAPLVVSDFNAHKSQLKVIEAGFHKKALIASETMPYTIDLINSIEKGGVFNDKGNALLVEPSKNHKQWGQHMKRLIDNPNLIEDLGNKLYETVKDTYSLKKVCEDRVSFLKSIVK
jgi:glycosyltransferase involved in cell wall biosynthesis